jgi:hypothetical protein
MAVLQPTPAAMQFLADLVDSGRLGFVNYVELALDVIVNNRGEALRLFDYLITKLVQKWSKSNVRMKGNGCYFGPRKWGRRQFVLYWDRPSKITGEPCVHIEMRLSGKAVVRRSKVNTFERLLRHDHRAFWVKNLRLEEVDISRLGKQFRGRARAKKPDPKDSRIGMMLAISSQGESPGVKAQEIRSEYGGRSWFRPQTCMIRIDTRPYLPTGANNV